MDKAEDAVAWGRGACCKLIPYKSSGLNSELTHMSRCRLKAKASELR